MNVYDFTVKGTNDEDISLAKYEGKVLLIVNTAPKCGYAPQYEGLEALYDKYKDQGFEVLNFPSNQFMKQAPGTNEEIKEVCELTYGTNYDIFAKIDVNGKDSSPLFKHLRENGPKELKGSEKEEGFLRKTIFGNKIKWNFTKFLIDRKGNIVKRFSPGFEPAQIEGHLKELL